MTEIKKLRDSKFELMRIVCMMLIIGSHYVQHSNGNNWTIMHSQMSINKTFAILLGSWGQLGVYGFVAISCFFLVRNNNFKSKNILLLTIETVFYCTIFALIGLICHIEKFSFKSAVQEIVSPLYSEYWFIRTYIVFFLITPFLKKFVDNISHIQLKK